MTASKIGLALLLSHLYFLPSTAQERTLTYSHYGIEEGLSHRQVNTIYQDHLGFVWVGTQYGLNRFDGYEFKWWTKEKNGLSGNDINAITEDAGGQLWIIRDYPHPERPYFHIQSIDLLDPTTGKVASFEEQLGNQLPLSLNDIYADFRVRGPDRSIYMGSSDRARLIRYLPSLGFQMTPVKGYRSFFPLAITKEGHFWGVGDSRVLLKIDGQGKVLLRINYPRELFHHRIAYDGQALWLQLDGEGLPATFQKINGKTGEITPLDAKAVNLPDSLPKNGYRRIKYDPANGLIWGVNLSPYLTAFPARGGQLAEEISEQLSSLAREGIPGNRAFFISRLGHVWLGGDFGMYKLSLGYKRFRNHLYTSMPSQPKSRIACRGIARLGGHLIVMGEDKGLYRVSLTQPEEVLMPIPDSIYGGGEKGSFSFIQDGGSIIWAAGESVFRADITGQVSKIAGGASGRQAWAMHRDVNKRIWIGTANGLEYLDAGEQQVRSFDAYNGFEALGKARVMDIIPDQQGFLWICSNLGLFTLDTERGVTGRYWAGGESKYHLPHDDIRHLYQDETGLYWLASGGGGLIQWDRQNQKIRQFTREDGLSNNTLYAIYEDQNEHLWLSSDLGIMQFDKNTHQVQTYLEEDGIPHNEFNRVSHYRDSLGHIYFGSLNGITSFDPKGFYTTENQQKPPLAITEFQQFDSRQNRLMDRRGSLLKDNKITLRPSDRFFNLSFALLSYSKTEQIIYAHRIDGWDEDWQYQKERHLRLGRLPYGNHLLRIKAQAAGGRWSEELQIPISVLKPFHLQWWFVSLMAGLASLSIITVYRFNLRRRLEQQEARQFKELHQLRSRFYTNITHEFRTPLTVILGMTEEPADVPKAMELIRRNGQKLLQLINQLLDLSKLDNKSLQPNYKQVEIVSFTQYIAESFQSLAEKKQVRLMAYSEIDQLWMDMDEEKYRQAISNLLSNAIKFTPGNGKAVLQLSQKDKQLIVKVKDNGIGIAAEDLPHIFDRFFQAPSNSGQSSSSVGLGEADGTGIGLALAKELVNFMEGSIHVESEVGRGTTFEVQLPIRRNASEKLEVHEPIGVGRTLAESSTVEFAASDDSLPTLLLIEDNPDVVHYIQSLLQPKYKLQVAADGAAGIEQAMETIPDIIISDVMMPEKDGFEVVETLKQDERTSHIPIILLTARATQEDRLAGLKHGADAYLMKPFDKEELFVRLEKLVELRQVLQQRYARAFSTITPSQPKEPSVDGLFLQKFRQAIDEKIDDTSLDISYLCEAMHLSPTQLHRKVKALTGEPPISFVRKVRLHKAKELLEVTELSIAEIAYETGFTDPNYFSRTFGKEFGEAPSFFRKKM